MTLKEVPHNPNVDVWIVEVNSENTRKWRALKCNGTFDYNIVQYVNNHKTYKNSLIKDVWLSKDWKYTQLADDELFEELL